MLPAMVFRSDERPQQRYPRTLRLDGEGLVLRLIREDDAAAIVDLARRQPADDLLYLKRDLTRPDVVATWLRRAAEGQIVILVAEASTGLVGYASIDREDANWTSHVRDVRVLVDAEQRRQGLGRALVREAITIAYELGAHKIVAQMPREQKAARRLFQDFGFTEEAVLTRHVRDRAGDKHDLIVMALEATDDD